MKLGFSFQSIKECLVYALITLILFLSLLSFIRYWFIQLQNWETTSGIIRQGVFQFVQIGFWLDFGIIQAYLGGVLAYLGHILAYLGCVFGLFYWFISSFTKRKTKYIFRQVVYLLFGFFSIISSQHKNFEFESFVQEFRV